MNRTLANKTLLAMAIALACASTQVGAAWAGTGGARIGGAGTGGTGAPAAAQASVGGLAKNAAKGAVHGSQIATWFGPGFYGQPTACGQTMSPVIVGVASRTLPCGTLVLVSFKGHRLTVPVIDRGPYAHNGAMWDLTWGAASALSITETVRVRTRIVGSVANSPLLGVPTEVKPSPIAIAAGGTAAR